jgi:hypothetical protein
MSNVEVSVSGERFLLNGKPSQLWGLRGASATRDDALTDHLIAQLDEYKAHGTNAVTVFYCGSSLANYDPFSADGTALDPGHHARMIRIIEECDRRGMVVVVGIFYQNAPFGLRDATSVETAVRTVTRALRPHRNVILNIANEQNSHNWKDEAAIFDFRDPEGQAQLCRVAHEEDPGRIAGAGGYNWSKNVAIGRSPDVNALLFDTSKLDENSGAMYDSYRAAGIFKPMANVEQFGAVSGTWKGAIFPEDAKDLYYQEIDATVERPGLSAFFFYMPWVQREPVRYDLGGSGRTGDPGVRWYFEHQKRAIAET